MSTLSRFTSAMPAPDPAALTNHSAASLAAFAPDSQAEVIEPLAVVQGGSGSGAGVQAISVATADALPPFKFFDDHQRFAAEANVISGVTEPTVPIYYQGALIAARNNHAVEIYDRTPNGAGWPSTIVDLAANTYLRATWQKTNGTSGQFGTSFAGTFSYRPAGGAQALAYVPTVDRAEVTINESARYTDVVSAHFGSVATLSSTRTFPDPTLAATTVNVSNTLTVQRNTSLATGAVRTAGDVLRAGTLASMFSSRQQFDASLILWEDRAGNVHSLQLTDATPRGTHLFPAAQELGGWIELVKGAGSTWSPDSPTVRLVIRDTHGLRLGLQGFLDRSRDPNADSLSVWTEILNPSGTLSAGQRLAVDFAVVAVAPLTNHSTYVTPFSAKLEGTPFVNVTLTGSADRDATGTAADNVLIGNSGRNTLRGGAGRDTLNGSGGADLMIGGDGDDLYDVDHTGDRVSETSSGGVDTVHSRLATYTLPSGVENGRIRTSGRADLIGNTLNNLLYAGAGNNVLNGGAGVDTVSYAYGLTGTTGLRLSLATTAAQVTGGSGTDTLLGIENLTGSAAADRLTGNALANVLKGGAGNDTLSGGAGNDRLYGEAGDDRLDGGTGNDILDGGLGRDTMSGGPGNDTYYLGVDGAADIITDNGLATDVDTVIMPYQMTSYTLPTGIENGAIAAGTAESDLIGNSANNRLTGNAGANVLGGGDGNDTLMGGGGDDILTGGTGNDTLIGGSGADLLTGGAGADRFRFGLRNEGTDRLTDFRSGTDKLQVVGPNFGLTAGTAPRLVAAVSQVTGTTPVFIYTQSTGALVFDSNGTGAGGSTMLANLGAGTPLRAGDFQTLAA